MELIIELFEGKRRREGINDAKASVNCRVGRKEAESAEIVQNHGGKDRLGD